MAAGLILSGKHCRSLRGSLALSIPSQVRLGHTCNYYRVDWEERLCSAPAGMAVRKREDSMQVPEARAAWLEWSPFRRVKLRWARHQDC
jgi:hypothetical protein